MKTVKITNKPLAIYMLRQAKELIRKEYCLFLCSALSTVEVCDRKVIYAERVKTEDELKLWIKMLLGGGVTSLQMWLFEKGLMKNFEMWASAYGDGPVYTKMRETRLAWIDWMISELEKVL